MMPGREPAGGWGGAAAVVSEDFQEKGTGLSPEEPDAQAALGCWGCPGIGH